MSESANWEQDEDSIVDHYSMLVANDASFQRIFDRYILTTLIDLTQLVHFRREIVHEVQRCTRKAPRKVFGDLGGTTGTKITWGALVQATRRYFEKKGKEHGWTEDQIDEQQKRWLALVEPAWVLSTADRRIDISDLKQWRDDFIELQKRDQGPYPACCACTSKCLFRVEVSDAVVDAKIASEFKSTMNADGIASADSIGSYCRGLTQRMVGHKEIDVSYCLAVHLVRDQPLSADAQQQLLQETRLVLEHPEEGGNREA